ncbi:MAG: glycosyltransferase family 2 protein [Defluviitaleaceae bacterium]|nr:glycosyltransferase family 2 protein [Defluviitaleaceae bacterium]
MKNTPIYSIVVPCYNEEEVITVSYERLKSVMDSNNEAYELLFVNDGSRDSTINILTQIARKDNNVRVINFSRNFGHQIAITAGMDTAKGSAIVVIDADLQDPPEVILEMIKKWKEGYDVVYGKRLKREGETKFKLATAKLYYRFLKSMTNVDIPVDTGDFRLIDRKVCDALKTMKEKNRYVRGLVSFVGYKQTAVEYDRHERFAGITKYPLKKMIKFAFDGLTSFSNKPLKLSTLIGFIVSILSGFNYFVLIFRALFFRSLGNAFMLNSIVFLQGLMFIMIGLAGEYIGRLYDEAKDRPLYFIAGIIDKESLEGHTSEEN